MKVRGLILARFDPVIQLPASDLRTGVLLIYNIMDEVEYNAQGNRVKMVNDQKTVEAQLVDQTPEDKHRKDKQEASFNLVAQTQPQSLLAAWKWWLAPAFAGLGLSYFVDPFIGDWDMDTPCLTRRLSLLNGFRTQSIFGNHALTEVGKSLFQSNGNAYLLLSMQLVQAPLAITARLLLT